MKKQFTTFLLALFCLQTSLMAFFLEVNTSYDYYRGLPDGSWNGNSGAFIARYLGVYAFDRVGLELGGSYGLYNWDGRQNLVFKNNKKLQQRSFITAGVFSTWSQLNFGLAYDYLYCKHFGIYDRNTSLDQLRFQVGYQLCCEEFGLWGTAHLRTDHNTALGLPVNFRAIDQLNFFWTHFFPNCAKTTVWLGAPYRDSLMYHNKTVSPFIVGFAVRSPITCRLTVEGHGSYMFARSCHGAKQSRNYGANICLGFTYSFADLCPGYGAAYMPIADNSSFMVDTNVNQ